MITGTLMIQGTSSDAGKSLLVVALCRWLRRQGIAVAPFKPQNMALNSAVTQEGGEIGRAQAVQAAACGLRPHTDMNPILLKPNSDTGAQVIVHGHAVADLEAVAYHDYKTIARQAVLDSYRRLAEEYQVVIVEGAGSPAEINLRDKDIANMGFAEAVDCPVILVADIDRGGMFAQVVGTLALLSESERARVCGIVVNRFRGDISLLQSGIEWLEEETGKPVLGVLPYLHGLHIDAEDAVPREQYEQGSFRVMVPALPHISNHTDFDPLRLHPGIDFRFIAPGKLPSGADLICLPGTKSVRRDLDWLRSEGWVPVIQRHLRYGGKIIAICGGFQMLGNSIHDPDGVEGEPGSSIALGLLDIDTTLEPQKKLRNVIGRLAWDENRISGYEIHAGITYGPASRYPATLLEHGADGAISEDGQILGTYVHGLFDQPAACASLLSWAGFTGNSAPDVGVRREADFERLADAISVHLNTSLLQEILAIPTC